MSLAYALIWLRRIVQMPAEIPAPIKVHSPDRKAKKATGIEEALLYTEVGVRKIRINEEMVVAKNMPNIT